MVLNLIPIDKWYLREVREKDLPILAEWMAFLLPIGPTQRQQEVGNILNSLRKEYIERRRVRWPHEYIGFLGELPVFTIYGYLVEPKKGRGSKRGLLQYHLLMTMNHGLPYVGLLWEPAWHLSLRHFFGIPGVASIVVTLGRHNQMEEQAVLHLGFQRTGITVDGSNQLICRKSDFIALSAL
jgi:hypothetical protein